MEFFGLWGIGGVFLLFLLASPLTVSLYLRIADSLSFVLLPTFFHHS